MFASLLRAGLALLAALTLFYPWSTVYAVGTAAGTTINNNATATYSIGGVPAPPISSGVSIRVDELINVRVTAPVTATAVTTPDSNKVLTFTITNIGNGSESFNVTPNLVVGGDQFDPTPGTAGQLFLDVNNNGVLDGGDTLITTPLTLTADQSVRVLLVSNIPSGRANGDQGIVTLAVASTTAGAAGAAAGTVLIGLGTPTVGGGSVDVVVGAGPGGPGDSGADDSVNAIYVIANVTVTINKAIIAVTSPFGVTTTGCNVGAPPAACTALVPGTIIQYEVTVTITGTGTAQAIQVTDDVPANTTYVANSIRFDTATRTDAVDPDNASCAGCGNAVGTVTVLIGNVTVAGAPITHVIDYKFTIN